MSIRQALKKNIPVKNIPVKVDWFFIFNQYGPLFVKSLNENILSGYWSGLKFNTNIRLFESNTAFVQCKIMYDSNNVYGQRWSWEKIDTTSHYNISHYKEKDINAENIFLKFIELFRKN